MSERQRRTIVGEWLEKDGQVVGNQECQVIDHLVANHFLRVADRDGGWTVLFKDPLTGSYWELTYPQGYMHGGGPPTLTELFKEEIGGLYGREPA